MSRRKALEIFIGLAVAAGLWTTIEDTVIALVSATVTLTVILLDVTGAGIAILNEAKKWLAILTKRND